MERFNRELSRVLQNKEFKDIDEINAYLQEHFVGKTPDDLIEESDLEPERLAQDLAYDSLESDSAEEALELAQRALEYDPYCADALMEVALLEGRTTKERLEKVLAAISKIERGLGKEFFAENRGYFWGLIETRPYMRALELCVSLLRVEHRPQEATVFCEKMLDLNPDDNQGIRDTLLGLYLQTRNLEGCRSLFDRYDTCFAVFAWGRVLERFLSNDLEGARKSLKQALKENRYVPMYLTGKRAFPTQPLQYYSPGDESEAHHFLNQQALAWAEYPEAIGWLNEAMGRA